MSKFRICFILFFIGAPAHFIDCSIDFPLHIFGSHGKEQFTLTRNAITIPNLNRDSTGNVVLKMTLKNAHILEAPKETEKDYVWNLMANESNIHLSSKDSNGIHEYYFIWYCGNDNEVCFDWDKSDYW